jgi:anti-sigma factor RsiW
MPARQRPARERWGWLTAGAVAGCAATALSWTVGTAILTSRAEQDFALAAVATHGRAALGHELVQIASSEHHTVKPWLSARLDYSPPVQDLAAAGFPLLGGRIDTIGSQPVAVLVYGYGQHTIDVFVRPHAPGGSREAMRTERGFHVARASGRTMDWLAVSDAEPTAVSALVDRLAREESAQ